jgi:hypothetical protein
MSPKTPGRVKTSSTTMMMNRRAHLGPPVSLRDQDRVKLDQRASSCRRATGSSPRRCFTTSRAYLAPVSATSAFCPSQRVS